MTADDQELYDRAADRHPTVIYVDPEILADRLFGPDPGLILGRWDDVYFRTDDDTEGP